MTRASRLFAATFPLVALAVLGWCFTASAPPSAPPLLPRAFAAAAPKADSPPTATAPIAGEVNVGELILLKSDQPAAWATHPLDWKVAILDEGKTLATSAGLKATTLTVFAATVADGRPAIATHVITIRGGVEPAPGPGPTPPVPPPQPEPDRFGIALRVRQLVFSLDRPTKAAEAKAVAGAFRSVASAIAAGTLSTPEAILAETRAANQSALGDARAAWVKAFFEPLAPALEALRNQGKLATPADFADCWRVIAAELERGP